MPEGDRPSRHGALLGKALARISEAGRKVAPGLPEQCLTCAFREGTLANQSAGTGKVALDCTLGIDSEPFGCHHGMKNDLPTKLCVGYEAAIHAPIEVARAEMRRLHSALTDLPADDPVRAEFDAWAERLDPDGKLDVYQLGRAYAVRAA